MSECDRSATECGVSDCDGSATECGVSDCDLCATEFDASECDRKVSIMRRALSLSVFIH